MKKGLLLASCFLFLASTTTHAQSVDLLWQGETYTPPFYKGKSLWSNQSRITFFAMTNGLGNPANLSYKWTKNCIGKRLYLRHSNTLGTRRLRKQSSVWVYVS